MKTMKKTIYVLFLPLAVLSGLLFTNCDNKKECKSCEKQSTVAANKKTHLSEKEKWEASPDGIQYKQWEDSPEGKKVSASYDKIAKSINDFSDMEEVITSVTFQRENAKASEPKWLIVTINDETYMMQFTLTEFESLHNLKVNDKIIVRSHSAGASANHRYLVLSGDYIAQNNKVLFKRVFTKNGC